QRTGTHGSGRRTDGFNSKPADLFLDRYRATSLLKVRSSVVRLIKNAFIEAGITMPDDAREVVFPDGIALTSVEGSNPILHIPSKAAAADDTFPPATSREVKDLGEDEQALATCSEGDLVSETDSIRQQARH